MNLRILRISVWARPRSRYSAQRRPRASEEAAVRRVRRGAESLVFETKRNEVDTATPPPPHYPPSLPTPHGEVIIRHPSEISSQESRPGVLLDFYVGDGGGGGGGDSGDDLMIPRVYVYTPLPRREGGREGSVSCRRDLCKRSPRVKARARARYS